MIYMLYYVIVLGQGLFYSVANYNLDVRSQVYGIIMMEWALDSKWSSPFNR